MEHDVGKTEPADAAAAFEALRREVALLNVAVAGLAAERAHAPDYSETLGEIAKGVSVAVGRLGKVMTSAAFAVSPADLARQIASAGEEARRLDRAAVHQAQEALSRSARDLDGWIDRARLASAQNWRLVQAATVGVVAGAILCASLPTVIVNAAPPNWAWPEKRAANLLRLDMWSAGERLLAVADPQRWQEMNAGRRIIEQNRVILPICARAAQKANHLLYDRHRRCSWNVRRDGALMLPPQALSYGQGAS